jgi:hypothetical protein
MEDGIELRLFLKLYIVITGKQQSCWEEEEPRPQARGGYTERMSSFSGLTRILGHRRWQAMVDQYECNFLGDLDGTAFDGWVTV